MKAFSRKIIMIWILALTTISTWAQDKKLDIDIDVNHHHQWYQQTWVWVVGAAVFILLLVALLRPKRAS